MHTRVYLLLKRLKRFLATFILFNILGWTSKRDYNLYSTYRKGKHIVTYVHASFSDQILGVLFCAAYDIPYVSASTQDIGNIPVIGYILRHAGVMFIDRFRNTNTVKYISEELKKRENFAFVLTIKDTINGTNNNPKFYQLAYNTNANVHILKTDYNTHSISIEEIANDAIIQTYTYEKIRNKLLEKIENLSSKLSSNMSSSIDTLDISVNSGNSGNAVKSIINVNKSILIYIPPLSVMYILCKVLF